MIIDQIAVGSNHADYQSLDADLAHSLLSSIFNSIKRSASPLCRYSFLLLVFKQFVYKNGLPSVVPPADLYHRTHGALSHT